MDRVLSSDKTDRGMIAAKDHSDRLPGLESQLNKLVYQAYDLTEVKTAIVEGLNEASLQQ